MSIKVTDLDFERAKKAVADLDRTLGNFAWCAPEDSEKVRMLLERAARAMNEFATAMCLIKPQKDQQ